MISFLSIFLWNAERPGYFDIFFQTGFTPPCAGPRQRDLRFTTTGKVESLKVKRKIYRHNYSIPTNNVISL